MTGPKIVPTAGDGRRRLSESHREKLRAVNKAKFASLTPEQQEAQRARMRALGHASRKRPADPPPPASTGGPRNPLDDALGDREGSGASSPGRSNVGVPPRFIIPDLPPLEPAVEPAHELDDLPQPTAAELGGFTVDVDQIADLVSLPFDFVADRRGAHWRLKPLERERLAGALARKINQHAAVARALDVGGDWAIILGGFGIVISARLAEDARHAPTEPDNGARPGLAGLELVGRRSRANSGAPAPAPGPGPGPVQLDELGSGPGSLNGYGTAPRGGDEAVAAETAGRLAQTFR